MRPWRWIVSAPVLIGLAACGSQPASTASAPSLPPSPKSILLKIDKSGLKDAHFALTEQLPDGSGGTVQGVGEGFFVLKPTPAVTYSLRLPVGGAVLTIQSIAIGETIYHRRLSDVNWTASPGHAGLTSLDRAYDLLLNGEDMTPQGKAWHLSGTDSFTDPFHIWIREKDGYPVKYSSHDPNNGWAGTFVFDRYNTGQKIAAPPASQVVPG